MRALCVFCGSSSGARPAYASAARDFGALLARERITLVWGGGNVGLMGEVANAVLDAGGRAIGVIPAALARLELAHARASEMHVVDTMHERKALMADLSDAFVALPGGFGTFDELFEIVTWAQLGIHQKPIGLLDVEGYFEPFAALVERTIADAFVKPANRELLRIEREPERLLARLRDPAPPPGMKWIGREAR